MRSSPASRMPRRGGSRGTPARSLDGGGARTQEAAARALSIGSGGAAGSRGFSARRGGRRRCPGGRATRSAGGAQVLPALAESAGSGLGPAAELSERREDAIPAALSLRNGSREPAPGPPASPPRSRGAAGRGTPTVGSFEGFPSSRPSRGGEGREGTRETQHPSSVRALQRKPALGSLALLFSEPLPAPVARSQTEERKKKRGGGGAADSGALPALLWEDSSAATGGEGLRAGSGEGARCSAGSGPKSSLRGRRLHRPERRGKRVPEGRTTSGRGAEARSLLSARSQLSETLQGLRRSARNPFACRKFGRPRCGVRGGEAGEGKGFFCGSQRRGWCAGVCEPRQPKALSLKGRNR